MQCCAKGPLDFQLALNKIKSNDLWECLKCLEPLSIAHICLKVKDDQGVKEQLKTKEQFRKDSGKEQGLKVDEKRKEWELISCPVLFPVSLWLTFSSKISLWSITRNCQGLLCPHHYFINEQSKAWGRRHGFWQVYSDFPPFFLIFYIFWLYNVFSIQWKHLMYWQKSLLINITFQHSQEELDN